MLHKARAAADFQDVLVAMALRGVVLITAVVVRLVAAAGILATVAKVDAAERKDIIIDPVLCPILVVP
jgi:hypothetical protein